MGNKSTIVGLIPGESGLPGDDINMSRVIDLEPVPARSPKVSKRLTKNSSKRSFIDNDKMASILASVKGPKMFKRDRTRSSKNMSQNVKEKSRN